MIGYRMKRGDAPHEVRNFCIIAHIDHGKSTLADRIIQKAKMVSDRDFRDRLLDSMDIERERGITIKSQAISIPYSLGGVDYLLNLVDTPGHVDFTYEVSRAIAACEGALLLVDASQGVEAQTLSNFYIALEHDLTIVPVINKIDLPAADVDGVKAQIERDLGLDAEAALLVSAKQGLGVDELMQAIVERIPAPKGLSTDPLQALVFDSVYDAYRGVIVHVRLFSGEIRAGDLIRFWSTKAAHEVELVGMFGLKPQPVSVLKAGDVGYMVAGVKSVADARVGDTVTQHKRPCAAGLPGFRPAKPVVFASIYPIDADDYDQLVAALERLTLNDAALSYEKDSSAALGFGFRCGFLGLLHLEIIQERLEREFSLGVILTAPSVSYQVTLTDGSELSVDNPLRFPAPDKVAETREPYVKLSMMTPPAYLGQLMQLCLEKRGEQRSMSYSDERRVELVYDLPLAEVIFDFHDRLKSVSRGYASFDYELTEHRPSDLVRLDILLNGRKVDALAQLLFRGNATQRAREICRRLKEEIPRHQFKVPIQGAIGGQVIARETITALRKDVTAKCYGGDISRKRKLLERQREGKRRMKMVGDVELPKEAFLSVLKSGDD